MSLGMHARLGQKELTDKGTQAVVLCRQQATGSKPAGWRRRGRALAMIGCAAVVLTFAAGCGSTAPPPAVATAARGPLLTLVTAQYINTAGQPRGIAQYFSAAADSVTAVVLVGKLDGPTALTMTWSRLTAKGPQPVFSKQLTVTSFDVAYTTAVTPGTLPYGSYQVAASMGRSRLVSTWTVYTPRDKTFAGLSLTERPLRPGPAGTFPSHAPQPEVCNGFQNVVSMPTITTVHINVRAYCPPSPTSGPVRGVELATMNRNEGTQYVGLLHPQPGGILTGSFVLNICKLTNSSDVPGAHLWLTSIAYFHGTTKAYGVDYILPSSHAQPVVKIISSVPPGTVVHPGERIRLHIIGTSPAGLGPQIGIRFIRLRGPSGRIAVRSFGYPKPGCNNSRLRKTMTVTYTVPANAPKVLTLTALASDTAKGGFAQSISFQVSG